MSGIMQDVRRAIRLFRQAPWFTWGIILILALGTGLNSAVLAVTYGILLRPLPYAESSRLAVIEQSVPRTQLDEWARRLRTVEGVAGFATADHSLRGLGEPRIVRAAFASRAFFDVLRAPTIAGRAFSANDQATGVIISERLVTAARQDVSRVVGSTVRIADRAFPVLAVLPASVDVPSEQAGIWVPAEAASEIILTRGDARRFTLLARVKADTTLDQVRDDVMRVARELAPPAQEQGRRDPRQNQAPEPVRVVPVAASLYGAVRPIVWAMTGGALLVLLVACANVASLLLSRTVARERETAMRLALGASPTLLVRSLFVEGLLLALAGSTLGVGLAIGGVRVLRTQGAVLLPRLDAVRVDTPVLALALTAAFLVALLCTVGPGLHAARRGLAPLVRLGGPVGSHLSRRMTSTLVVAQIALSIVVLVVGGLLAQTVARLLAVDMGINASHALTMKLMLGERTMLQPGDRRAFVEQLVEEVRALPGVQAVGLGSNLPPSTSQVELGILLLDDAGRSREGRIMMGLVATHGDYLTALGTRLLRGRLLDASELSGERSAVVVSRSVAEHLFHGRDAVGQPMPSSVPGDRGQRPIVVGIVDDVRYKGLSEWPLGAVYTAWDRLPLGAVYLVIRMAGEGDPTTLAPAVRAIVQRLDPAQPIAEVRSLADVVHSSVADRRLHAGLSASFALLAFTVAMVGLVAAMSRAVINRRRELAVRSVLGATRGDTVGLVMASAARLAITGVAIGVGLAALAARGLSARFFGITAYDPVTYALVAAAALLVALLACLGPAARAASVDPCTLLRAE